MMRERNIFKSSEGDTNQRQAARRENRTRRRSVDVNVYPRKDRSSAGEIERKL